MKEARMRRNVRTTLLAIAAVAALTGQAARAQMPQGAAAGPPLDAQLKAVLDAAANAQVMLRGAQRVDAIAQTEWWATGTAGDAKLTAYHAYLNYNVPGMRVDMTKMPGGRTIEVVSGNAAWNESEIGGGLVPGKGTATPMMNTVNDRLLRIWMMPSGVIKGARLAGNMSKVATMNGKTTITFPAAGTMIRATLDAKNLPEKVEARFDNPATAIVTTYAQYADWNDADLPQARRALSDVQFPKRITTTVGGKPVLDITITKTDTNNPYVIMPVPPNVK
jgi:hypothetical protein